MNIASRGKLLIISLLIVLCCIHSAQAQRNYTDYHNRILSIEECNSRESFDSSIVLYSEVFSKYDRVMARDAFNACQIGALQKSEAFYNFFLRCAQSGITIKSLLGNALINTQYRVDSVRCIRLYQEGYADYMARIDTALRSEMIERAALEQRNKGNEKYAGICSDNFNRIIELCSKGQFPGEDLIGNSEDIENIIFPTLCHYPYSFVKLESCLNEAVKNGSLTPLSLVYLYGFNQTRKSVLYTNDIANDTIHFNIIYNIPFGLQSYDFSEVNMQRRLRGIFTMEVQERLRKLRAKYGVDYLMGYY